MEDLLQRALGWLVEEAARRGLWYLIVSLLFMSGGGALARWYFGKKYQTQIDDLRNQIQSLGRAHSSARAVPPRVEAPPSEKDSSSKRRTENNFYDRFKSVEIFTVANAVYAWCEQVPGLSYLYDKARNVRLGEIEQAIISEYKAGEIKLDHSENHIRTMGYYEKSYISRADLLKVAKKREDRPSFLFPEGE